MTRALVIGVAVVLAGVTACGGSGGRRPQPAAITPRTAVVPTRPRPRRPDRAWCPPFLERIE